MDNYDNLVKYPNILGKCGSSIIMFIRSNNGVCVFIEK